MNKLPTITFLFWIMKICATTLGETAGDLLSMTLNVGYAISTVIVLCFFFVTFLFQLFAIKYRPAIFWMVMLSTSIVGTTMSDYIDRSLGLGYATGSIILIFLLIISLSVWRITEKSIAVTEIKSVRGEIFYWTSILLSNTLGTALGDFIADNSGLGFKGGALLIGSLLLLVVLAYYFTKFSHIVLFWVAFVLTRPFGATFGDLLTKPLKKGGLNLGTIGSSLFLFVVLAVLLVLEIKKTNHTKKTELV